jgi:hypothetical protein
MLLEHRLVVERIDVAGATIHKAKDDVLGLGWQWRISHRSARK